MRSMEYCPSQSLSEGAEYDVQVGLREKLGVNMGGDNKRQVKQVLLTERSRWGFTVLTPHLIYIYRTIGTPI